MLAFANAFYLAGPRISHNEKEEDICKQVIGEDAVIRNFTQEEYDEGGWTCTRYDSFISTLNMLFSGDFLFSGTYPYSIQSVLSMIYSFKIGIILLNIIIAVISDAFGKNNSELASWFNRYQFLAYDVVSMEKLWEKLLQYCFPSRSKREEETKSNTEINTHDSCWYAILCFPIRLFKGSVWHYVIFYPIQFIKRVKISSMNAEDYSYALQVMLLWAVTLPFNFIFSS